jgi:uncharacterized protein YndB with AHSA1/START domain
MFNITATRLIQAPIERVFDQYCDHVSWSDWAGVGRVVLLAEGSENRDGVGAIRRLPGGGQEEVVLFERPSRMEYRIIKGAGIRNHHGTVVFTEIDGATQVHWSVDMEMTMPFSSGATKALLGWVFRRILKRLEATVTS